MADLWTQARRSLRPHPETVGDEKQHYALEERMRVHHVSAVSIAVLHEGRLVVEEDVGKLAGDQVAPADAGTVFGACSISKAVTAMAILRLVAAGKLSLDADVNSCLRNWQLTDVTRQKVQVTLRQILSHTAGINIHGADGYDPAGEVPTFEQILNGLPPSVSPRVHVVRDPGTAYQYSSGGYIVLQKLICDVSAGLFEEAMPRLVFEPVGMKHSTFAPDARGQKRAAAHVSLIERASPETALVWPALAPAGLWTTAGDLARLVLAIQKSYSGTGDFLPRDLAREALRRQTPHHDIGLGLYLLGSEDSARRFSHTGGYLGYKAEMMGWINSGDGAAVMINNGYTGAVLKTEIIGALARAYGWRM